MSGILNPTSLVIEPDLFTVGYKKKSAGLARVFFPEVSVIKCSNYRLTGTSMSQVVDRFVFDKIQS